MKSINIFSLLIFSCLLLFSTCKKDSKEFRPVANFSTPIIKFGEVTFRNKSLNATEYFWDFDDGNTSTEIDPVHKYLDLGIYNVKLTASDGVNSDTYVLVVAIGQIFPENLTRLEDLPFGNRAEMMNFTLNEKVYVGCGINTDVFDFPMDIWRFDSSDKEWTEIDNNLDFTHASGVSFTIGTKAFVGTGNTNFGAGSRKFYEFDGLTESFGYDSELPSPTLISNDYLLDGISFSYEGKGYVMGSIQSSGNEKQIWEYEPTAAAWIEKGNHPMNARAGMFHFQVDEKIIIGMGNPNVNSNFDNSSEIWEYNVITDTWIQKNDFPGTPRRDGISFTHNGIGYFGFGNGFDLVSSTFESFSDLWKYDYDMDTWEKIADMPVSNKFELFGFVIENSLYFGSGYNTGNQATTAFYEFKL